MFFLDSFNIEFTNLYLIIRYKTYSTRNTLSLGFSRSGTKVLKYRTLVPAASYSCSEISFVSNLKEKYTNL